MKFLFLLFIVMPIVEITLLIKVGEQIGALNTALLVVLTAFVGSLMLRQQGLSTLFRAQTRLQRGQLPLQEMLEGIFLAVGGALLITPGFVTDVFGFLCLLPASRRALARLAGRHVKVYSATSMHESMRRSAGGNTEGDSIEGEFRRDEDSDKKNVEFFKDKR